MRHLERDAGGLAAMWIAFGAGALILFSTLPLALITGTSAYWRTPGIDGIDAITALTGLRYFLAEPWSMPLLELRGFGPNGGISAVYTDSIPVLALLLKTAGVRDFNPYGWWIAACYLATPLAAVRLARLLGVRSLGGVLATAIIAACFPAFQLRLPHAALESSQAFILVSLELYFRRRSGKPAAVMEAVIPVLAMGVHPYILAFCLIPLSAGSAADALAGLCRRDMRKVIAAVLPLGCGCVLAAGLALALGVRPPHPGAELEWGHYSMNLMSPLWPRFSTFLPVDADAISDPRQIDARAWPGFGILALCATGLVVMPWRSLLARHAWLAAAGLFCVLFAVTTEPSFGPWRLGGFYPALFVPVTETFRASGRFAWVAAWMVIMASVASVGRMKRGTLFLVAVAAVQFVDTAGVRTEVDRMATNVHPPWLDRVPALQAMARATRIEVHVPYDCVTTPQSDQLGLEVVELASETRTPIDSARAARRSTDCAAAALRAQQPQTAPGLLRLFLALPGDPDAALPAWTAACPLLPGRDGVIVRACR